MNKRFYVSSIFFLLSFVASALLSTGIVLLSFKRSTAPLPEGKNLRLSVLDVSCTEAWLSLKSNPVYYGKTLKLFRGDSLVISKTLSAADSLLYDQGLRPNSPYTYKAEVYNGPTLL